MTASALQSKPCIVTTGTWFDLDMMLVTLATLNDLEQSVRPWQSSVTWGHCGLAVKQEGLLWGPLDDPGLGRFQALRVARASVFPRV